MLKDDAIRIRHMLDAACEACSFASGKNRSELDVNRQLVLALVKDVEIIGEAGSKVSQESRNSNAMIPWADIINMRNRFIHAYFDVDLDILWDTVTKDMPLLIVELEKVLAVASDKTK